MHQFYKNINLESMKKYNKIIDNPYYDFLTNILAARPRNKDEIYKYCLKLGHEQTIFCQVVKKYNTTRTYRTINIIQILTALSKFKKFDYKKDLHPVYLEFYEKIFIHKLTITDDLFKKLKNDQIEYFYKPDSKPKKKKAKPKTEFILHTLNTDKKYEFLTNIIPNNNKKFPDDYNSIASIIKKKFTLGRGTIKYSNVKRYVVETSKVLEYIYTKYPEIESYIIYPYNIIYKQLINDMKTKETKAEDIAFKKIDNNDEWKLSRTLLPDENIYREEEKPIRVPSLQNNDDNKYEGKETNNTINPINKKIGQLFGRMDKIEKNLHSIQMENSNKIIKNQEVIKRLLLKLCSEWFNDEKELKDIINNIA